VAPAYPATHHSYAAQPPASLQPSAAAPAPTSATTIFRSGPGRLRRAPFYLDNKPTYALESSQGNLRIYVTAQQGLNLEPYVNRNLELLGPMFYHGQLKTNYMAATQVIPLP